MKKSYDKNTITRSLTIDVYLSEEEKSKYKSIVDSIRHYRSVCRHIYALIFEASAASADMDFSGENFKLKPNNERCKKMLALAMDKVKDDGELFKAPAYEVRDYVMKSLALNWKSFVFDSMRAAVMQRWDAPDTEFPKAKRGFMTLQGARGVARFQRIGISLPQATAKPRMEGHSIVLNWDRDVGEIEFKFQKLDGGRFWTWKNITSNPDWSAGSATLTEIDGKIRIGVSYTRPKVLSDLDPSRELVVSFSDEKESFMRIQGPEKEATYDSVSADAALAGVDELKKISDRYDNQRRACGNKNDPWGFRKAFKDSSAKQANITRRRELQIKDWNHRWTRRVIENAKRWRCGKITVSGVKEEALFGRPWRWHQLKTFMAYKAEEIGGVIEIK